MINNTHAQAICYNADRRLGSKIDRFWGRYAVELPTLYHYLSGPVRFCFELWTSSYSRIKTLGTGQSFQSFHPLELVYTFLK